MSSSLTREKTDEICQYIKANPDSLFGQKYWQCRQAYTVQIQQKSDRWDTRFLAIAKFRVFLLNGKSASNLKIERSFNILSFRHLELLQQEQILQMGWDSSCARQTSPATVMHIFVRMPDGAKTHELALELLATLKHYFPEVQKSLTKLFLVLGPPSLLSEFPSLPVSTPELPCHNFRRSYVAYCDWMEQPFRDEVIWDIERIYFFHNLHELDLNDFSHLTLKDQQALIGSIQFSEFFTGICADGIRLQPEQIDALILLIRRSHSLTSLQLSRCVVPKDFLQLFAAALLLNLNLPLERLRLAGIPLDDRKGLAQLAILLPQLPRFQSLSLPECFLNEKLALILLHGIHNGIGVAKHSAQAEDGDQSRHGLQLKALNLSGNPLGNGTELGEHLANLLALNSAIRLVDLTGTAVQLDRLWAALKLGGLCIEVLKLGSCHLAPQSKRSSSGKDSAQVARELFSSLKALKELNLAGTHLNADLLHGILSGLASNPNLPQSRLNVCLDNCIVGSAPCITMLEQQLPACSSIRTLSLRDNSLEHETFRLLSAIGQMPGIRSLDIGGGNFIGLKANKKHSQMLSGILAELVKLVNDVDDKPEGPIISELSLSDSRLGSHLGVLLNALGLSRTLKRLDLSNCELGPGGARLLGKSIQLNQSLQHLSIDRNQIGPDGFLELARALRLNSTLLHLQLPSADLADSMLALSRSPMDRNRLMLVMVEIEQTLQRNGQLAAEGPTQDQLAMRTIHSLNNRCDRYDVNGTEASEIKKMAFHKISKLVTQMGEEGEDGPGKEAEGSVEDDKRARLTEHLAERIEKMALENGEKFLRKFSERLSAQEEVEMQIDGNQKLTNGLGTKPTQEGIGKRLRQDMNTLIEKYTNEFSWDILFTQMDHLLCASEIQNHFRIREKLTKAGSETRRGILVRNGHTPTAAAASASLSHRPVSAMMAEERMIRNGGLDLMSQSVMGNFAATGHELEEEEGQQGRLMHLAKQRPKPARQNRSRVKAIEEEKTIEEIDSDKAGPSASTSIIPPIRPSSESSSLSASLEQSLEQSPLMQQQRRKHQQKEQEKEEKEEGAEEEEVEEGPPELPTTSPPPIPKKGTRESSTPPKLPPKPSPNAEELRSKKTRVLPAVEAE